MSRQTVIGALNRLMANQCCSLVDYLSEAPPWTHPGNEALVEATRVIVADHEHYAQRLADVIEDRDGCLASGSLPMTFLSLNDLALDYLYRRNGKGDRTCCPAIETIEFIGGPYDGHKELCRPQTVQLPTNLVWIVCEDAFRMLEGRDSHPGGSITSVALYELEAGKDAGRYRFTRSISLEELMESMPETCSCLENSTR